MTGETVRTLLVVLPVIVAVTVGFVRLAAYGRTTKNVGFALQLVAWTAITVVICDLILRRP